MHSIVQSLFRYNVLERSNQILGKLYQGWSTVVRGIEAMQQSLLSTVSLPTRPDAQNALSVLSGVMTPTVPLCQERKLCFTNTTSCHKFFKRSPCDFYNLLRLSR